MAVAFMAVVSSDYFSKGVGSEMRVSRSGIGDRLEDGLEEPAVNVLVHGHVRLVEVENLRSS